MSRTPHDRASVPPAENHEEAELPVTEWLRLLDAGDPAAAEGLYNNFCTQLRGLIHGRLPATVRAAYDQDDAAISAFHSLFLGVREQRFQLSDRKDFWRLLLTIAERKVCKRMRHEHRERRDVRRRVQDSLLLGSTADKEPAPALAAEVAETCEVLLEALPDDRSREIVMLRLESYTPDQIADRLGCSRRTVDRKLLVVRKTWERDSGIEEAGGAA